MTTKIIEKLFALVFALSNWFYFIGSIEGILGYKTSSNVFFYVGLILNLIWSTALTTESEVNKIVYTFEKVYALAVLLGFIVFTQKYFF